MSTPTPASVDQYLWMIITGGFVCFAMAWGIGANDVANAFSTSIGAKAINIKQAVFIAGIFEFGGAVLLGGKVTDTVRKKIVDFNKYEGEEDLLLLGMFCAMVSGAFWLGMATKYSLPVSTTHTIIGSIIGFAWISKGFNAIDWIQVGMIVLFWIVAPILCGICSVILFIPIRSCVLRKKHAYELTLKIWPLFVFLVCFIMSFFLMVKGGGGNETLKKWAKSEVNEIEFWYIVFISIGIGFVCALIAGIIFLIPYNCPNVCCGCMECSKCVCSAEKKSLVQRFVDKQLANHQKTTANGNDIELETQKNKETETKPDENIPAAAITPITPDDNEINGDDDDEESPKPADINGVKNGEKMALKSHSNMMATNIIRNDSNSNIKPENQSFYEITKKRLSYGMQVDIHEGLEAIEYAIHNKSEQFDFKVEKAFSWLQVLTAALDIFAHGSNDVANAIAPFAAMVGIYQQGGLSKKVAVPEWILVLGGLGMTIGLATYGYKIMKVLGVRMAAMSSTRGYCIELSSALIIIICSHNGLPASTTHAQVGSTLGVGLCELCVKDTKLTFKDVVNWKLLAQVFLGWILTLIIAASVAALVYAYTAFSPCSK